MWSPWSLGLLLAICTFVVYYPVLSYPFVNYDDNEYVTENQHVQQGFTAATVTWAIQSMEYSNWHPVTWLSHALDCQIFGKDASGPHLVNVLIHAINGGLLFLLLFFATAQKWRSLFVGALFALHPLNVESVAWIAQRKNVLCMLFLLLTLLAYGWYARKPKSWRYILMLVPFALGLASKAMIVTLPFLLILLDYWPLRRIASWSPEGAGEGTANGMVQKSWSWLLLEKIPLLALSLACCVLTLHAQRGSIPSSDLLPLSFRVSNAIRSCVLYFSKAFWPNPLVVYYPLNSSGLILRTTLLAAALLLAKCVFVWTSRSRGHVLTGWLWFLGSLVPMIGLVQVGNQAMADRYAYLPLIGLFVLYTWELGDMAKHRDLDRQFCIAAGCGVILVMGLITRNQIQYWSSSSALWTHTLDITEHNLIAEHNLYLAEDNLAYELLSNGHPEGALPHFQNAARLAPTDPLSHWALAASLEDQGHLREALQNYLVVANNPQNSRQGTAAWLNLAVLSSELGDYANAAEYSRKAMAGDIQTVNASVADAEKSASERPSESAYLHLGILHELTGNIARARQEYELVVRNSPSSPLGKQLLDHLLSAYPSLPTQSGNKGE